jgi:hypothetical protein
MAKTTVRRRPSNAGRGKGLAPMNGMAGAGLACGIFALVLAIGIPTRLFAVVAVVTGVIAVAFSAKGRSFAHALRSESRIAIAGLITGGLAMVIGLLVLIIKS